MKTTYTIKKFSELTNNELYELIQLRIDVFVVEQNCAYQDCDDKDKEAFHLLGYQDEILVSYTRLLDEGISYQGYCSIGRVVTNQQYRKQSLGKELMQYSIDFCLKKFSYPIKISAQLYLEKFYTELGFTKVSNTYLEDNIPHIAMIYKQ